MITKCSFANYARMVQVRYNCFTRAPRKLAGRVFFWPDGHSAHSGRGLRGQFNRGGRLTRGHSNPLSPVAPAEHSLLPRAYWRTEMSAEIVQFIPKSQAKQIAKLEKLGQHLIREALYDADKVWAGEQTSPTYLAPPDDVA